MNNVIKATEQSPVVHIAASETDERQPFDLEWIKLTVTESFKLKLRQLLELTRAHDLSEVRVYFNPDCWGPGDIEEEAGVSNSELVVTAQGAFWFETIPAYGEPETFESEYMDIELFLAAVERGEREFGDCGDDLEVEEDSGEVEA